MQRKKVIVCGARFGQFYMEAVRLSKQYELAGILARGSELAAACAERYQTKLYTHIDKLPEDVKIACVAVKTTVLGGTGTELAVKLMQRGISVILEQPVHYQDLTECYRTARKCKTAFMVGNLYLRLPAVKRFLGMAEILLKKQEAVYLNVDMATQVSYPLVSVLTKLFGKGGELEVKAAVKEEAPFQTLYLDWRGTAVQVRAQNQEDSETADNYMHLLFGMTLGTDAGALSLTDANGVVWWRERMEIPPIRFVPGDLEESVSPRMKEPSTRMFADEERESYGEILKKEWSKAVLQDIDELWELAGAEEQEALLARKGGFELSVAKSWQIFMQALGYPIGCHRIKQEAFDFGEVLREYCENTSMEERYKLATANKVREAVAEIDRAALLSMLELLQDFGLLSEKDICYSREQILQGLPMKPEFGHIIGRWLTALGESGYVEHLPEGCRAVCGRITKEEVAKQWERAKAMWSCFLGPRSVAEYFYSSAMQLKGQLSGSVKANYLLYPEGKDDIAKDLYRNTMIAWYLNKTIAERTADYCRKQDKGSVRILEVGAGTGATSDVVIGRLVSDGLAEKLKEYTYTDISQYFLVQAKERYGEADWLKLMPLNIDWELEEQGIGEESCDIIIAAGVLNNGDNITEALRQLRKSLKREGILLISEAVGESVQMLISQVFMMELANDARGQANSTFMTEAMWREAFREAGLICAGVCPDGQDKLEALGQRMFLLKRKEEGDEGVVSVL